MRYAVKMKATNLSGDNPSVMTFNTLTETEDEELQKINAARLYAYITILQEYGIMSSVTVQGITAKPNIAGLPTLALNVGVDQGAYEGWLIDWNGLANRPALLANPVSLSRIAGEAFGNQIYGPIGTSVMITEQSSAKTGRCFMPSPQVANVMDFNSGKVRGDYQAAISFAHGWVCRLQETDVQNVVNNAFGVFSSSAGIATRITRVSTKTEFSNLASRRR